MPNAYSETPWPISNPACPLPDAADIQCHRASEYYKSVLWHAVQNRKHPKKTLALYDIAPHIGADDH